MKHVILSALYCPKGQRGRNINRKVEPETKPDMDHNAMLLNCMN
jgi:hypothetical protein